jgi:hypothetical protein
LRLRLESDGRNWVSDLMSDSKSWMCNGGDDSLVVNIIDGNGNFCDAKISFEELGLKSEDRISK